MRRQVFITRDIKADSPLWQLEKEGIELSGQSLIKIDILPITLALEEVDWIYSYSGNGVRALEQCYPSLAGHIRLAGIGPKTTQLLSQAYPEHYVMESYGDVEAAAQAFVEQVTDGQRVAFIRAQQSKKRVQKLLPDDQVVDIIGYRNTVDPSTPIPHHSDIVVCTSPMNAESYLLRKEASWAAQFIAIGPTTADYLYARGVERIKVCAMPTEEGIREAVEDSGL